MAIPPLPTVTSSSDTFSVANLSDDVIASVSPQTPTKDVLPLTPSSVSSPVTSPLMKTVLTANLDRGVADDKQGTVYLRGVDSRYSLGIKTEDNNIFKREDDDEDGDEDGEYEDEHYDEDEVISRTEKVKRDRIRKLIGTKEFTKRGCVYCKYGLGIRFRC